MFEFVSECIGHQNDIRGVCTLGEGFVTASRDRLAKIWTSSGVRAYDAVTTVLVHEHWVNAVVGIGGGGFATGSQDGVARLFDHNGALMKSLKGHTGPVTSLHYANGKLATGSWDGSARVWDTSSGTCEHILQGHENGVCVLLLDNGIIVTGSAGEQQGNEIVGYQLRMWQGTTMVKSMKDHQSAVRGLCGLSDGCFASASNDGTVRVWSSEGDCMRTMDNGGVFNFGIVATGNDLIAVACDDCCVRVWSRDGDLLQEIPHPSTVWCVCELGNGDILTGSSDGVARVFSQEESRISPESVRSHYNEGSQQARLAIANKQSNGGKAVDVESLPQIQNAPQGDSEGQVRMFNDGGVAMVYQWSGCNWDPIGEVMSGQEELDGEMFDRIIPVELEDPGKGLRKLKLGFNNGENPFLIAQKFVNKHGLDEGHVEEIAAFVQQNGGGKPATESKEAQVFSHFPLPGITGLTFETVKLDMVLSKINDSKPLEDLVRVLGNTNRYHSSSLPQSGIDCLTSMLNGDELLFPVLDLFRIVMTHPGGPSKVNAPLLWEKISKAGDSLADSLTASRLACNFFCHRSGVELYDPSVNDYIVHLGKTHENKNVKLAAATFVLNVCNMHFHNCTDCDLLPAAVAIGNRCEGEALKRCLIAIGCCSSADYDSSVTDLLRNKCNGQDPGLVNAILSKNKK